ncbi:3-oxo-tetronate kinase [Thioclava sp. JE_KL1]|uniref:3-oxo-tetronate kinase n=1 Tax=Thioclava sp. JE_KL1 TaxID=2651187 RepID=UPI0013283A05|nr:four-carbon acid sugar kinase family protein [Thioclava sp. JE_KL1]
MMTVLGCIADDFTGATDLAALLARSGVPVSLRIGVPKEPPAATDMVEVVALKTRTAPVEDAVAQARAALHWLQEAGAQRFFWKYCSTFDSTEAGNIGPVAEALMRDLNTDQTIYCPAFPENGRTIFMGNLFVGQQPLAESPMKDHPLTPMRDSNLLRLLGPQVTQPVGLVDRLSVARGAEVIRSELAAFKASGTTHIVIDAVAESDLEAIATACREMPLLTGASSVAMPLPKLLMADQILPREAVRIGPLLVPPETVVLSGSCSAMTQKQVLHYLATGAAGFCLDPLELAATGAEPVLNWLMAQDLAAAPLIYATSEPAKVKAVQDRLGVAKAGRIVEETLAACACAARDAGARRIIVAGGETSGAVTNALGLDRLHIGAEISAGVPWTYGQSDGFQIALALKSGNFGTEAFFSEAQRRLETA